MLNSEYTSGMNDTYDDNSKAQSLCHIEAKDMIINSVKTYIQNYKDDNFTIGVFGCGPGDNDLECLKNTVIPLIKEKYGMIKIFMIDVAENKWSKKEIMINNNIKIIGLTSDIYKSIFPDNYFDLIISFSCLHWIKKLPFQTDEIKDCYSWGFLNKEQQIKLNNYMNESLDLFLKIRNNELKENGRVILSFDANVENELHQYQGPTNILAKSIKELNELYDIDNLFCNFFIPTAPRKLADVKNVVLNNFKIDNIFVKKIKCPLWENKSFCFANDNTEYSRKVIDSIMSCVLPFLKDVIKLDNFDKLIIDIENRMEKIINKNTTIETSTCGNVMFLNIYK